MTHRRSIDLPLDNDAPRAAFHAEVAHLMAMSPESFAELDPRALPPLTVTIRATSREVTSS